MPFPPQRSRLNQKLADVSAYYASHPEAVSEQWSSTEAVVEVLSDAIEGGGGSAEFDTENEAAFFAITNSTNGDEAGAAVRPNSAVGMEIFVPTSGSITYGTGLSGVTRSSPPTNQVTIAGPTIIGVKLRPNVSVYVTAKTGSVVGRFP